MGGPDVVFLLRVDGSILELDVPCDPVHGLPVQIGTVGWRMFLEEKLRVRFLGDRPTDAEWHMVDVTSLPSQTWQIKERKPQPQDLATTQDRDYLKVKVYTEPYVPDYLRHQSDKNRGPLGPTRPV